MFRKALIIFVCAILASIPLRAYLHAGIPYTHDGENHLARFANYKQALREGQFPPRFAPNLMNRYGYPVFNYNYPLPSIVSVPLSLVGFTYIQSFKLIVVSAVLFGALGILALVRRDGVSFGEIVITEALYLLNPYLFGAIVYRGSIGEIMSLAFFPWLWWWMRHQTKESSPTFWLVGIGLWSGFLLAHNVGVLIGVPILLILALSELGGNWLAWRRWLASLAIGIALTLWFWLPAFLEKSAVVLDSASLSLTASRHLPTISQLLFSPQSFGFSFPGSIDTMSFSLGLLQMSTLCILTAWWVRRRMSNQIQWQKGIWLAVVWMLVIGQTAITVWVWDTLPLIRFIQFPWRLSLFLSTLLIVWLASEWKTLSSWVKIWLFVVVIVQGFYLSGLRAVDFRYLTDVDYEAFSQSTTTANENLPKEFTYLNIGDWQPKGSLLTGGGHFNTKYWTGSDRLYYLHLDETSTVVEPTMHFLGWRTSVSTPSQSWVVEYTNNATIAGRIAYQLPAGEYTIRTTFTQETPARLLGNTISLMTAIGLAGWWWYRTRLSGRDQTRSLNISQRTRMAHDILNVSLVFWVWRIGLFILSWLAPRMSGYRPSFPYVGLLTRFDLPQWLYSWANFDGVHYLTIVQEGYFGTGLIQAFFPGYPALVWLLNVFLHNIMISGLVVANLSAWLFILSLWGWSKSEFSAKIAWVTIAVFLFFPTSFFIGALYSESFFLLSVVLSFWAARRQKWWLAGILAAVSSATRLVGILLVPALLVELFEQAAFQQRHQQPKMSMKQTIQVTLMQPLKEHRDALVWIGVGSLGLISYMLYLNQSYSDALYFFHVQSEFGTGRSESFVSLPQVVWRYLKILLTYQPRDFHYLAYVQELLMVAGSAVLLLVSFRKVRWSYWLFSLGVFLIPTLTGTFSSMPRYILPCLVFWIFLAQKLSRAKPWVLTLYLVCSGILLIINCSLFIQGYWVA